MFQIRSLIFTPIFLIEEAVEDLRADPKKAEILVCQMDLPISRNIVISRGMGENPRRARQYRGDRRPFKAKYMAAARPRLPRVTVKRFPAVRDAEKNNLPMARKNPRDDWYTRAVDRFLSQMDRARNRPRKRRPSQMGPTPDRDQASSRQRVSAFRA
ncbi:hypothetical protein CO657_32505 (plasmid) [Rhizobium acidisoli]|uniref:Uncharacterized protein n=1 Tax=Rhizobium acidisoli TaxID=1538158 RepID=A0AAE5WTY7_9HYPH|nr:hypothetical protein [Rhizobium acidisoli]QAS82551.1 hypothetical protein CO657_32505 [Rhizobium acidisoli]